MTADLVSALIRAVISRTYQRPLHAIIDAARDPRIYDALQNMEVDARCLYRGTLPDALARVAPYLVHLNLDSAFGRFYMRNGWKESWGVLLKSERTFLELHKHFRSLLIVQRPNGKRLLFRYYDPRVLRAYLPTCTGSELRTFFGPVDAFITSPERRISGALEHRLESGTLTVRATNGVQDEG